MDEKDLGLWLKRANIVGRAQERYLWFLLIAGVFFVALDQPISGAAHSVSLPVLNLPLRPDIVWAVGPLVLGFLLVAAMGSLRAYRTVEDTLKAEGVKFSEAFDSAPNALDFAFYTTADSPLVLRKVFLFVYPTYFAVFVLEAAILLYRQVRPLPTAPAHPVLWGFGVMMVIWGAVRVVRHWLRNAGRARSLT